MIGKQRYSQITFAIPLFMQHSVQYVQLHRAFGCLPSYILRVAQKSCQLLNISENTRDLLMQLCGIFNKPFIVEYLKGR